MTNPPDEFRADDLDRLADAVEAYIERRDGESGDSSLDAYLAEHEEVRDLLEPMLDDRPGDLAEDGAARRLGGYLLGRELGRGGMGVVYEAVEESLGRRVALKVLAANLTLSARQIERFRREAAAAAKLVHPDIVRIHAVGEQDGTHFIAMELVEGRSLRVVMDEIKAHVRGDASRLGSRDVGVEAVTRSGTKTGSSTSGGYFDQVGELAARIAEALAYSHERGVVHRDIKPQNVLVGAGGRLCVVDFGLAKDLDAESLSMTGEFAGTPQYVSPEQVDAGRTPVDGRSDVFSLGVVLYELLTLSTPFAGSTTRQVMTAITSHEPPALRSRSPHVPRDLETIALKALEKDPRRRYTAAELAADLRRYLAREPITARPISTVHKVMRLARRNPAASLATVLAFLLVVVAPIVAMIHYKSARDEIAAEQQRTIDQRDLARKFLAQARAAVSQLYIRVAEFELDDLPHTEPFRMQLLRDARDLSEGFLDVTGDDPVLRYEAARAQGALARLEYSLSRNEEARQSMTAAIDVLTPVATLRGMPVSARLDLAVMHQLRSQILIDLVRFDEATADIERCHELIAPLRKEQLSTKRWREARAARAALFDSRRRCALRVSATVEAQTFAERCVEAWKELLAEYPDDQRLAFEVAHATRELASIFLWRGRLRTAQAGFKDAARQLTALLEQRPGFPQYRIALARSKMGLADVYRRLRIEDDGSEVLAEALLLFEALANEYPDTPLYRREYLRIRIGQETNKVMARGKALAEAAEAMPALVEEAEKLAAHPGSIRQDRFQLAKAYMTCTQIEASRTVRDDAEILRLHAAAISTLRGLVEEAPLLDAYRLDLAGALSNKASYFLFCKPPDPEAAMPLLDEAIALQSAVIDNSPGNLRARAFLKNHLMLLAAAGEMLREPALLERAATGIVDLAPTNTDNLTRAVEYLACASLFVEDDEERVRAIRDRACGWLRLALPDDDEQARRLLQKGRLTPLREHPDFLAMTAELGR